MKAVVERLADRKRSTEGVYTAPHSLHAEFEGTALKILGVDAYG